MVKRAIIIFVLMGAMLPAGAVIVEKVIAGVPAYNWYHGCGPTALASVFGYWDQHGMPNLFNTSGSALFLTANVQDQISSPAHNAKYDPSPDVASLPTPPMTSVADFLGTSVNQDYGSSALGTVPSAIIGYAASRGYQVNASNMRYNQAAFNWEAFTGEIDAGRPMLLGVDSDGNRSLDHFVAAFGYSVHDDGSAWYACYNTWHEDETVDWYRFQDVGQPFGIWTGTYILPVGLPPAPVPGDANGDGKVNFADYLVLESTFGSKVTPGSGADFDMNGIIDFADYLTLESAFGTGNIVPEPATLFLLTLGGIALFRRR